jgi:magnesium-transporting ATPase (P-type)
MEFIKVDKFIKFGWIVAAFSGALTTVLSILAITSETGTDPLGIATPWNLLDGIIYLGLAYGIYKKSRISSILIFILHCYFHFYVRINSGGNPGFFAAFIAVIYLQAILATFKFHYKKQLKHRKSSSITSVSNGH